MNYRDARRFQAITVLLAAFWPIVIFVYFWFEGSAKKSLTIQPNLSSFGTIEGWQADLLLPWFTGVGWWPVLPVGLALALFLVTGIPSYFCHPRHLSIEQQNRAVAISYYGCAPLALLIFCVPVALDFGMPGNRMVAGFLLLGAALSQAVSVLLVLVTFVMTVRICARATLSGMIRTLTCTLIGVVSSVVVSMVVLLGIPWILGYVRLFLSGLG